MLFDFHTHTHSDAASGLSFQRRINSLVPTMPEAEPVFTGGEAELLRLMDEVGIAGALIIPFLPAQDLIDKAVEAGAARGDATEQIIAEWCNLNAWASTTASEHRGRLFCLVGFDPVLMDEAAIRREVARNLENGASGLKIAPLWLKRSADDPQMQLVWELAREHQVFVLSEAGSVGWDTHPAHAHPRYFAAVAEKYPDVTIVLAHLGWGAEDVVADLTARFPNIHTDLSNRLGGIGTPGAWTADELVAIIRRIGVDRVLFGTNYPMTDPRSFAQTFRDLPLTENERAAIGWGNAQRILNGETGGNVQ